MEIQLHILSLLDDIVLVFLQRVHPYLDRLIGSLMKPVGDGYWMWRPPFKDWKVKDGDKQKSGTGTGTGSGSGSDGTGEDGSETKDQGCEVGKGSSDVIAEDGSGGKEEGGEADEAEQVLI